MKRSMALWLIALAFLFTACQDSRLPEKATILIGSEITDSTICFIFTSNQPDITYTVGILTEEELTAIGGQESIINHVESQLADGTAIIKTHSPELQFVENLMFATNYYAYAVQLNEGAVYGDVTVSTPAIIAIDCFQYVPEYYYMPPFAISPNGRWVCGTDDQKSSYIIDLATGKIEEDIEGVNLRTIDNNGVAYGFGLKMQACKYENGEIIALHETGSTGNIVDVTGDGSIAAGYHGYDAVLYRNGQFEPRSIEGDCLYGPYDNTADEWYHEDNPWIYSTAREGNVSSVGQNGVCGGYIVEDIWSVELSCYWDAQGNMHLFGAEGAEYNIQERWFFGQIGTGAVMVSPNGKYVACVGHGNLVIFDSETGERTDIAAEGVRLDAVAAVTDNGHVYFSNCFIYTPERGFELLEYYVEDVHGKTFDVPMEGYFIGVSDDEKRILITAPFGDGFYITRVFFL